MPYNTTSKKVKAYNHKSSRDMKGSIKIIQKEINNNNMGWDVFDFFKETLKQYTNNPLAGWYARKEDDGIHEFLWCDGDDVPSKNYLKILKENGWII